MRVVFKLAAGFPVPLEESTGIIIPGNSPSLSSAFLRREVPVEAARVRHCEWELMKLIESGSTPREHQVRASGEVNIPALLDTHLLMPTFYYINQRRTDFRRVSSIIRLIYPPCF